MMYENNYDNFHLLEMKTEARARQLKTLQIVPDENLKGKDKSGSVEITSMETSTKFKFENTVEEPVDIRHIQVTGADEDEGSHEDYYDSNELEEDIESFETSEEYITKCKYIFLNLFEIKR